MSFFTRWRKSYDPNEPRDKDGKWTSGGDGGSSSAGEKLKPGQYRQGNYIHDEHGNSWFWPLDKKSEPPTSVRNAKGVTIEIGKRYDKGYGDTITVESFSVADKGSDDARTGLPIVLGTTHSEDGRGDYRGWAYLDDLSHLKRRQ